jgi:uncharacterized integral membrane protein
VLFLIFLLFFLICAGLAALTVLNFTTLVHINILTWQSPDLPIGFWMIMGFVLGAIIFYLFSIASAGRDHREIMRLRGRVSTLEKQQESASTMANGNMAPGISQPSQGRRTGPLMPMPGAPQPQHGDLPPQNFR